MKWLSKLEGLFSPDKAKPVSFYESAQTSSRRRSPVPGGKPQEQRRELRGSSRTQIQTLSNYAHRNSGLSVETQRTMAIYAVGAGRWPQSKAESIDWRKLAERRFWQMVKRPEITGRYNWRECQKLVCRHLDKDGEIFVLKTRDQFGNPKIQLIESHAISNVTDDKKNIFDGIQYDEIGRPINYLKTVRGGDPVYIPASAMIHVFDVDCVSSSRFIPPGQHGLLHVQDELEMLASEKHAVKTIQQTAMVLKSNRENALDDGDFGLDSEQAELDAGTMTTSEEDVARAFGAVVQRVNENEELKSFDFQRPYSTFGEFLGLMERDACGGGPGYEFIRDPSEVGGASVRLVVSKAVRYHEDRGAVIDDRFSSPVWVYFIGDEIAKRRLDAVRDWTDVEWTSPKKATVDAGRESQAARLDLETGITTWSDELGERGKDFDDWIMRRTTEARQIMRAAGHADSEPIPLWMIYKPQGVSLSGQTDQNTEL